MGLPLDADASSTGAPVELGKVGKSWKKLGRVGKRKGKVGKRKGEKTTRGH